MTRRHAVGTAALALVLACAASCIDFSGARAKYCGANPDICDGGGFAGDAGQDSGSQADAGTDSGNPGTDAGGSDAAVSDAGCKGTAPTGGQDSGRSMADAGNGTDYYVSPTGVDVSSHGSRSLPWLTVGFAASNAASPGVIHVCAGTYVGSVNLTAVGVVSILGGYNCADGGWNRTTSYGFLSFDAGFDRVNETLLTPASGECAPALNISGGNLRLVDGLTIQGSATGCSTGFLSTPFAVEVSANAVPTIQNCDIRGGGGTGGNVVGSGGIFVSGGAAPDIGFNWINGGSGTSSGREGSIGIFLDQAPGSPHIHDNVINGGSGVSPSKQGGAAPGIGSIGIGLYSGPPDPPPVPINIEHNWITGGNGSNTNTTIGDLGGQGSVGIYLYFTSGSPPPGGGPPSADIFANYIEGGTGTTMGNGAFATVAIRSESHASVWIDRNAVYGGDSLSGSQTMALFASTGNATGSSFTATNNMIHAGGRNGMASNVVGVRIEDVTGPTLEHNTIFAASSGTALDLRQLTGGGSPSFAIIVNNLTLSNKAWGLTVGAPCSIFSEFNGNAFIGIFNGSFSPLASLPLCGGGITATTPAMLEAAMPTGVASGTLVTRLDCTGVSGCVTRPGCSSTDPFSCIADVVQGITRSDLGYPSLIAGSGWPLAENTPCAIMSSAVSDPVLVDYFSVPRASRGPSVGAAEQYCGCN